MPQDTAELNNATCADEGFRNGKPVRCWEHRGCEGLPGLTGNMTDECPHARTDCYSPCPADCNFTACQRAWHKVATSVDLVLDPTVDRSSTIKVVCRFCEHFLRFAPRVGEDGSLANVAPDQVTSEEDNRFKIHLF